MKIRQFCLKFLALYVCTAEHYTKKSYLYKYSPTHDFWMLSKIPIYTFIQSYTFISFTEIFPPICLFSPILLFFIKEISHLYFHSDSSSIRNYRVIIPTSMIKVA